MRALISGLLVISHVTTVAPVWAKASDPDRVAAEKARAAGSEPGTDTDTDKAQALLDASAGKTGKAGAAGSGSRAREAKERQRAALQADKTGRPRMTKVYRRDAENNGTVRRVLKSGNRIAIAKLLQLMKTHPSSFLEQTSELNELDVIAKESIQGRDLYNGTKALYPDFDDECAKRAETELWDSFAFEGEKPQIPLRPGGTIDSDVCLDPADCPRGSAIGVTDAFRPLRIRITGGFGHRPEPPGPPLRTQADVNSGLSPGLLGNNNGLAQVLGPLLIAILSSMGNNRRRGGGGGGYPFGYPGGYPFGGNLARRGGPGFGPGFAGGPGGRGAPAIAGPAYGGIAPSIYQPGVTGGGFGSIYNNGFGYGQPGGYGYGNQMMANQGVMRGIPPSIAGPAFG